MSDTLTTSLLLEAFERLGAGKKTGVMVFIDGSEQNKIYVYQGAIVYIGGTTKEARLEHLLVREKFFSLERIKALLVMAKKEKLPLLHLLVDKKLTTLAIAEKLIGHQAWQILKKAARSPDGTYEFQPAKIDSKLVGKIRYDCHKLVRDITVESEASPAAGKGPADEASPLRGPFLKHTILQKMKDLPPNLQTVVKAKKMLAKKDADFEALQRVLETDQSMTANILKIANSPFYGLSGKISSLKHALSMLGLKTLSQVITLAGTGSFLNSPLKGYGLTAPQLREHSLAVGFGSRSLAARVNPAEEEDAFIAGLLHDAGKIMLDLYVAEEQLGPGKIGPDGICELEKSVLECDHTEIAADVFSQWRFPANVFDAIRFHHNPAQSGGKVLPYIINAADMLSKVKEDEIPVYEIHLVLNEEVSDFLGLEQDDIAAIFIEIKELEKNITQN